MPRPILYICNINPMSRAVGLTAAAIGVEIDVRNLNLLADEHRSAEFTRINPEHTLPTLDDNGLVVTLSHSIMKYLVRTYAQDDSLYPQDIGERRGLVDDCLKFSYTILYELLRSSCIPILSKTTTAFSIASLVSVELAYRVLDETLNDTQWLCGDSCTLADISCITMVSTLQCVRPIANFPNVVAWFERCKNNLPQYATINLPGCQMFRNVVTQYIQ